jgi:hypothetical protein
MSAASECYLNFIMVGIYLAKNDFNSKNYVFFPNVTQFSLHRYIANQILEFICIWFLIKTEKFTGVNKV